MNFQNLSSSFYISLLFSLKNVFLATVLSLPHFFQFRFCMSMRLQFFCDFIAIVNRSTLRAISMLLFSNNSSPICNLFTVKSRHDLSRLFVLVVSMRAWNLADAVRKSRIRRIVIIIITVKSTARFFFSNKMFTLAKVETFFSDSFPADLFRHFHVRSEKLLSFFFTSSTSSEGAREERKSFTLRRSSSQQQQKWTTKLFRYMRYFISNSSPKPKKLRSFDNGHSLSHYAFASLMIHLIFNGV